MGSQMSHPTACRINVSHQLDHPLLKSNSGGTKYQHDHYYIIVMRSSLSGTVTSHYGSRAVCFPDDGNHGGKGIMLIWS